MADDDLRQFMRELLTRFERRTVAMERRLDAQTDAIRDMSDQIRANTQAVLHVLDELRGRGPAQA